jgi:hypothetical protein
MSAPYMRFHALYLYLCALRRHFIFPCALCVLHLGSEIAAQTEQKYKVIVKAKLNKRYETVNKAGLAPIAPDCGFWRWWL